MNIDTLAKKSKGLLEVIKRYRYPLVGAIIVALFGFTVWRIDYLSAPERDEEAYNEQLSTVERINFDEEAIEEILKLRSADVDISPNFPGNRTNPF